MKLEKKYFNQIDKGDTCIFRNEFGEYILCVKLSIDRIAHKGIRKYTGQEHGCYLVELSFIDKCFANFQWYLKRQWAKTKKMESKRYE